MIEGGSACENVSVNERERGQRGDHVECRGDFEA